MSTYPDYILQMLARARDEGQWHAGQAAAALCFNVLALFPDCAEASELVYELFCDEWTIYDNRVAIQRNMDEWDDRPWQQRRRLALSFRFMSRWEGWKREYLEGYEHEKFGPPDVAQILEEGKMELLGESCSRFNAPDAKRLLVEVVWWRDNVYRIPWIPPRGDGSRYKRMMVADCATMMSFIDSSAPSADEEVRRARVENTRERIAPYRPSITPQLASLFTASIPAEKEKIPPSLVDWSFLDEDDGQPGEPADWVNKQMELFEDNEEIVEELKRIHRWTRNIPPPSTPPRYDSNAPPFDPGDVLGDMDDDE